jgi:hypothetical protein
MGDLAEVLKSALSLEVRDRATLAERLSKLKGVYVFLFTAVRCSVVNRAGRHVSMSVLSKAGHEDRCTASGS